MKLCFEFYIRDIDKLLLILGKLMNYFTCYYLRVRVYFFLCWKELNIIDGSQNFDKMQEVKRERDILS